MKSPKVEVSTDNMNTVTLSLLLPDARKDIVISSNGNTYQGLHAIRSHLEEALAELVAGDTVGWKVVEPPPEEPAQDVAAETEPEAAKKPSRAPKGK